MAAEHVVAYEDGSWVRTDSGPVRLKQGDPLPDNVHPDEVARLANAGVLEGITQAPELEDEIPDTLPDGDAEEIKTRVGTDPDLAQAYLDQEGTRSRPRKGLVSHLEEVVAAAEHNTAPTPHLEGSEG